MTPAVEVAGLTVHYGEVRALDDVSLRVRPGRVTGLIGMNGSGKSTLFKTVMGLTRPDRGSVVVDGISPAAARRRGLVGYVPQSEDVDRAFPVSVRDVAMMGRYGRMGLTRRARAEDRTAVARALERVELSEYADRQIGRLSGGQAKRAFVARGIAQAIGLNPRRLGALLLGLLALTAVVALQVVGVILVVAMLIIPGSTAYLLTDRFGRMLVIAPVMSTVCAVVGIYLSYWLDAASGGLVVVVQGVVFGLVLVRRLVRVRRRRALVLVR
ncbi:metal ABC transporter permease [Actinoplanes sp. Pm04-4]|uniref:Metal ABC transporter permease n=1 Tax=Paractinoplanes pyxinae TaxID=2997416 RepID=A0ABT4ATH3_9ACTN|nr:metal ABC transporter permease [Actinoplanes pyxinae]MCY1136648.1 metal ABC transporter permease [Actinoplanes pyxinae]